MKTKWLFHLSLSPILGLTHNNQKKRIRKRCRQIQIEEGEIFLDMLDQLLDLGENFCVGICQPGDIASQKNPHQLSWPGVQLHGKDYDMCIRLTKMAS